MPFYANDNIGVGADGLEADIRSSQKISDDWSVEGSVSDSMAAFISYPQDKSDHTFSVYIKHGGLSFGYFFRAGGGIFQVEENIAEFTVNGCDERAFISMNKQKAVKLEFYSLNGLQTIDIDSDKPFALVLPANAGDVTFYDVNGDIAEYYNQSM